jgi:hypothetical protein
MGKMGCLCGGVMSDSQCPRPTEGWLLRDQDQDGFLEESSRDITSFFAAVQSGGRREWIDQYFSPQFGVGLSDEGVVFCIIADHKRRLVLSVAECETCGRIWLQRAPGLNSYRSFLPDESGYAGVLRSQAAEQK